MAMNEYILPSNPVCRKEAVIQGDRFRITMLTEALVRLEYSRDGVFEDRPTQSVLNRDFPVPAFRVADGDELDIYTSRLEIHYNRKTFAANGLSIKVNGVKGGGATWHFGEEPEDLGGTARTLDMCDGPQVINLSGYGDNPEPGEKPYAGKLHMEHGLLSKRSFSLFDDSRSMVLTENGWIEPRKEGVQDIYFFGYGHDYLKCLKDFYHLCGKTPLLPRYAMGNWWSRYHRYTEEEYKALIERFEEEEIPFSVAVVDMDWHLVDDVDPKYGKGWTGYTWNRKFFPDPKRFMSWLHDHNMRITLNVHPADGIRAFEDAYPRMAEKMGIDPATEIPVQFDPADPRFMEAYLKDLHHPMEEEGVDFWWVDWQQGTVTKVPGLDPLWMLNHYHYLDSKWKGCRPMTFSRYAGIGSHRYPVGFSGDTVITWESLQFQPYFTSTASNIGYGWWSHDIGGHMLGVRDDELMARWVQFGVFSPINRLHSTDNPFNGKEPWKFDRITENILDRFLRLRHAMVPYLYTMNRRASRDDLPLVEPLYYLEPEQKEAYQAKNEYYFGSELLVSPITEPLNRIARAARATTWLPEGRWADFFTGIVYEGGRMINVWRGLENMPVFMKTGAIVPMKDMSIFDNSVDNPEHMQVRVFAAADGDFTLWEDAGDTPEDLDENWASTELSIRVKNKTSVFKASPAAGNLSVIPAKRSWKIQFAASENGHVCAAVNGKEVPAAVSYDETTGMLTVQVDHVPVTEELTVTLDGSIRKNPLAAICFSLLEKAQTEYEQKAKIQKLVEKMGAGAIPTLNTMNLDEAIYGEICEILTAER